MRPNVRVSRRSMSSWFVALGMGAVLVVGSAGSAAAQIVSSERQALIDFYNSTDGPAWCKGTCGWMGPAGTECSWGGVSCTADNLHVRQLWIAWSNDLNGTIPESLGDLTELEVLLLDHLPGLNGPIPQSIGNLTKLKQLFLASTNLSGPIPDSIGNLVNLEEIDLRYLPLSGPIPDSIGNLVNLRRLSASENRRSGAGLESPLAGMAVFSNLSSLEYLSLWRNKLTGDLSWLGSLTNLTALSLADNQFTGEIPDDIANLSKLQILGLSTNQLTGDLYRDDGSGTSWLDSLPQLTTVDLDQNQLSGTLPMEIESLANLGWLGLGNNAFTGGLPDLGLLSNLSYLNLRSNALTGTFYRPDGTSWLGDLTNLRHVDLRFTQIGGSLPDELGNLTGLQYLWLQNQPIDGPLPDVFDQLANLRILHIISCGLTGPIPPSLGSAMALTEVRLSSNYLTGPIPPELGNLPGVGNVLFLNTNRLSGPIPPELFNLQFGISVEYNRLSGPLPAEIIDFPRGFLLRYNALYSDDPIVLDHMASRDPAWVSTQTVAPADLAIGTVTPDSIELTWTPIPYTAGGGGYRVFFSETASGPFIEAGMTAGKTASSFTVTGLDDGKTYYLYVETESDPHGRLAAPIVSDPSPVISTQTVALNSPPDALCAPVTVAADAACGAMASVDAGSIDPDGDPFSLVQTPAGPYGLGTTAVTLTATDSQGASDNCSTTVTVVDSTPPILTCPAEISLSLDATCQALVPDITSLVAASDNCSASGSIGLAQDVAVGLAVLPGSQVVTVTGVDAFGNAGTCQSVLESSFDFDGFLPPIGGADATGGGYGDPVRTFKLQSTIPVKFQVSCAGTPYTGGSHILQTVKWTSQTDSETPIDATPQEQATAGNLFRLTGDEWHFNLDTQGTGMSPGQWELIATLSDGTQHRVWVQVK